MSAPYWVLKCEFGKYWTDKGKPTYGWTSDRSQIHHYETREAAWDAAKKLPAWKPRVIHVVPKRKPTPEDEAFAARGHYARGFERGRLAGLREAAELCMDTPMPTSNSAYDGARACAFAITNLRSK